MNDNTPELPARYVVQQYPYYKNIWRVFDLQEVEMVGAFGDADRAVTRAATLNNQWRQKQRNPKKKSDWFILQYVVVQLGALAFFGIAALLLDFVSSGYDMAKWLTLWHLLK